MNMRVLHPSRKRLRPGDIFAYQMPDDLYRFGRVIRTDTSIANWPDVVLVYLYRPSSVSKLEVPWLGRNNLLIPPVGTNRLGWSRGYFETVAQRPLQPDDVLPVHCFEETWTRHPRYWTEDGDRLPDRTEPCGVWALSSYANIDADLSEALGFPEPVSDQHG